MVQFMGGVRQGELAEPQATAVPRVSPLSLMVMVFVVGAAAFTRIPIAVTVVKGFGFALAAFFILLALRANIRISAEVILYAAWVGWSPLGVFGGAYGPLFWQNWFTVVQIAVLLFIISGHADSRRTVGLTFGAFLVGALIVGTASVALGTYRQGGLGEERLTGLGTNPNGFGRLMLMATACLMYFWTTLKPGRAVARGILVGGMVLLAMGIIASGSRFSILGLLVLYGGLFWFCYRQRARPGHVLLGFVLVLAVAGVLFSEMRGTALGNRFVTAWRTIQGEKAEGSASTRIILYKKAFAVLLENPFIGIGLNNLRIRIGRPGHADWSEVACGTGIPGAILYFAIYWLLWHRAGRIRKSTADVTEFRIAGLIRAVVLAFLFIGLGSPHYSGKANWIMLGSFIGYSGVVWHRLKAAHMGQPTSVLAPSGPRRHPLRCCPAAVRED